MPIFRGVEISVVASREAKKLPEYPHPEGSSVRLVVASDAHNVNLASPRPSESSILSDGDPTRQRKVKPRVSVYIPSMPGEQFWLKYHVIRPAVPASHLYFKMYLNGHLITSWGVLANIANNEKSSHPHRPISGTVVRALYEPGEKWQEGASGVEWKSIGIETRYFHFMPGLEKKSVAEDGGLIEVQVFRSKGRKRRTPKMTEFRTQERYGIASPSGGLVENPQDATYYDWLLIDPKDAPYATFCFHYRSMKHLLQLNLVPQSESRPQIPRNTPGMFDGAQDPSAVQSSLEVKTSSTPKFAFGVESLDNTVFSDEQIGGDAPSERRTPDNYFLKSPPKLLPVAPLSQAIPQPSKALREANTAEILRRPLPEPPQAGSRPSSRSSARSSCPSLTPSMAQYVDSGGFGDEDIEIGLAQTVAASNPSLILLPQKEPKAAEKDSSSDYDNSPPSTVASRSPDQPLPKRYLSTTGSVLERQIESFSSPIVQPSPRRVRSRIPVSASEGALLGDMLDSQLGTLKLTESEWIRRTPSPIQRRPIHRLWSPRLEKKPSRSRLDEAHRPVNKHSSWEPRTFVAKVQQSDSVENSQNVDNVREVKSDCRRIRKPSDKDAKCDAESKSHSTSAVPKERHTRKSCRDSFGPENGMKDKPDGNWI